MSKSMTVSQLVAAASAIVGKSMDETAIRATLKAENVKSQKRIVEVFTPLATPTQHRYRSERIIEAGPRGFRFSDKWKESVKSGSGIAVHPSNLPKLMQHADSVGVLANVTEMTPVTIAAAIAATL